MIAVPGPAPAFVAAATLPSRDPEETFGDLREDFERHLKWLQNNGLNIRYITHPCEALCVAAVKQTGLALEFILFPSKEVCQIAIEQNPRAIHFCHKK